MITWLGATLAVAGCDLDDLISALNHQAMGHHAGGGGAGGALTGGGGGGLAAVGGAGGGFTGLGGAGGGGGSPVNTPSCQSISQVPGMLNPCGRANSLAYSPDGKLIAMATDMATGPTVRIWRLGDGALVRDLPGLPGVSYDVAFSPNGKLLAVAGGADAGDSNAALIYDVASGNQVRMLPTSSGFYSDTVAFSNDGALVATAGSQGPIEVWRVSDGARVAAIPYPTSVHNLHFAPSGQRLIAGGVDGRATVWDLPAGTPVFTLSPIADEMSDADFSPDGTQIASTGPTNDIRIWDVATHALLQSLTGHGTSVSHTTWIDQNHLVTNDWAGDIRFWARASSGQMAAASSKSIGTQSIGIAVSPDRHTLAVGASESSGGQAGGLIFFPL
jgi:WD40 repeat protein